MADKPRVSPLAYIVGVEDQRLGAAVKALRIRRKLRQQDLADAAGMSRATISLLERGHCDHLSLATLRRVAAVIDLRLEIVGRWRGGDLERLLNRRHSLLAESFAAAICRVAGWVVEPEVSFSVFGERGVVDQLAWNAEHAHLLLVELKTQLVDVNELLGTFDRKRRLARQIAMTLGWDPKLISVWLVVSDTSTNRRHAREHATLLGSRFQLDGRQFGKLLRHASVQGSGLAFWSDAIGGSTKRGIRSPQTPKRPG